MTIVWQSTASESIRRRLLSYSSRGTLMTHTDWSSSGLHFIQSVEKQGKTDRRTNRWHKQGARPKGTRDIRLSRVSQIAAIASSIPDTAMTRLVITGILPPPIHIDTRFEALMNVGEESPNVTKHGLNKPAANIATNRQCSLQFFFLLSKTFLYWADIFFQHIINQLIRMISEGSCDTGVIMLTIQLCFRINSIWKKQETNIRNCNISQYYCIFFWKKLENLSISHQSSGPYTGFQLHLK